MQAIITKYHGPTNSRGSRISARCEAGRVSIPYPYELSGEEAHRKAALALCDRLNAQARKEGRTGHWEGELIGGALPDCSGYAFVFLPRGTRGTFAQIPEVFPCSK